LTNVTFFIGVYYFIYIVYHLHKNPL
jgi:hypothetical protein